MALSGLNGIKQALIEFNAYKKGTRKEKDDALSAILEAATKTGKYIYDVKNGSEEDRDIEENISQLWRTATVKLKTVNTELANTCLVKAECWASPDLWKSERFRDIPVDLDHIFNECGRLLNDAKKP